jgi:HSP20 family protein
MTCSIPSLLGRQRPDHFEVTAEIPGFTPDQVTVNVDGRWLSLNANKSDEKTTETTEMMGWKQHRMERSRQSMFRRMRLPKSANMDGITAVSANGVLTLTVPKRAGATSEMEGGRKISIANAPA